VARHTAGSRPLIEYFNDLPDMSSRQAGGGKCTNLYACPVCSQDVAGQLAGLIFSCRQSNLPALPGVKQWQAGVNIRIFVVFFHNQN